MHAAIQSMSRTTVIKWFFNIIIPLFLLLVPTTELFTMQIKLFFVTTLFAICAFAFETMNQTVVSILMPLTWIFLGIAKPTTVFAGWQQYVPWVTLSGLFMAVVLERIGLLRRFAYWVISKTGADYAGILIGLAIVGFAMTEIIGGRVVMMATLGYGICVAFDFGKSNESAGVMLVAAISCIVPESFRFSGPLAVIGNGEAVTGPMELLGFLEALYYNLPLVIFYILAVLMAIKMFKPDKAIEGKAVFAEKLKEMGNITADEKKGIIIITIYFLFIITASWHGLSMEWGMALIPWLLACPVIGPYQPQDLKQINFGMVFFITACIAIGTVATSLGLGELLSLTAAPLLEGKSIYTFFLSVWVLMFTGNFIMTPMAMIATFTVPLVTLAQMLNINPMSLYYFMCTAYEQVVLPYEYAKYLIFFGFGVVSTKDFMKFMSAKAVLNFIICFALLIPWYIFTGFLYS